MHRNNYVNFISLGGNDNPGFVDGINPGALNAVLSNGGSSNTDDEASSTTRNSSTKYSRSREHSHPPPATNSLMWKERRRNDRAHDMMGGDGSTSTTSKMWSNSMLLVLAILVLNDNLCLNHSSLIFEVLEFYFGCFAIFSVFSVNNIRNVTKTFVSRWPNKIDYTFIVFVLAFLCHIKINWYFPSLVTNISVVSYCLCKWNPVLYSKWLN